MNGRREKVGYVTDDLAYPSVELINYQGEYLRLKPQDESDTSELVHVVIADLRFDNPWLKVTGSPIYRQESDRKESDSDQSYDGGLSAPSNEIVIGTSQVNGRFLE